MKFKELRIWQKFDFDRSDLPRYLALNMIAGPWIKVSPRCYLAARSEWETGFSNALDGPRCQVGTINVKVIPLP